MQPRDPFLPVWMRGERGIGLFLIADIAACGDLGGVRTIAGEMMALTFCVIDDEREICDLFRLIFESRGHRCLVAHNGPDGLAIVKAQKPAAVFLDVQMPRMNGVEVLAALRADERVARTPVLLMTALTSDAPRSPEDWARSTGADAFLPKPFELDELFAAVQRLTGIEP